MTAATFLRRNLTWYWRTNLAVSAGVAVTVAVLTGALLVGDSVRASLSDLVRQRLGQTAYVVASESLFREALATDISSDSEFPVQFGGTAPLLALEGIVTHEKSGRRRVAVQIYGVDERFWKFHGLPEPAAGLRGRDALISPGLAADFSAANGDALLIRVQRNDDVPVDSLHGRRDDSGRTSRLTLRGILPASSLGEFSLRPQQGIVRAVFVPLRRLQDDLKQQN
ncbi:MAG: ABC transporter permease, partial [Acidobacteria bacterium]|nr:ABC transporter permease [Acidobacteriota bacterium]